MALLDDFDDWVFDLDGTIYIGDDSVPGAPETVAAAQELDKRLVFVSNDPQRSSSRLAHRLETMGVHVSADRILHAGKAAALHMAKAGIRSALVLGTRDLADELVDEGIRALLTDDHRNAQHVPVEALLIGLKPALDLEDLELLLRSWRPGCPLVAASADRTYPGRQGPRLGNGSVAQALAYALGVEVTPCGKPSPILFHEAEALLGGGPVAMVGDSLEADVGGANHMGWTSIWFDREHTGSPGVFAPDHTIADLRELLD